MAQKKRNSAPSSVASPRSSAAGPRSPQNPALTRQKILKAGSREFAAKGLAGARISNVARTAGVNVQAIYYHFENKQGLYKATIEAIYRETEFHQLFTALECAAPTEAIVMVIDFMIRQYSEDATSAALLFDQEQRYAARELEGLDAVRGLFRRLIGLINDALKRGAADGSFRAGQDPVRLYISITALTGDYIHKMHTHSALLERDFADPDERHAWREHIIAMILSGLRPV